MTELEYSNVRTNVYRTLYLGPKSKRAYTHEFTNQNVKHGRANRVHTDEMGSDYVTTEYSRSFQL